MMERSLRPDLVDMILVLPFCLEVANIPALKCVFQNANEVLRLRKCSRGVAKEWPSIFLQSPFFPHVDKVIIVRGMDGSRWCEETKRHIARWIVVRALSSSSFLQRLYLPGAVRITLRRPSV